jgi:hypothetical protein
MESYRLFSAPEAGLPIDKLEKAKARVWQNLEKRYPARQTGSHPARGSFWGRRVSIPMPAVAAAVLLVIAAALWVSQYKKDQPFPNMTLSSEEYSIQPAQGNGFPNFDPKLSAMRDLDEVIQYLGSSESGDILIFRLPESRNFFSSGEPAIIKAADYSRRRH